MKFITNFLWMLLLTLRVTEIAARIEFTNVKCTPLDKSFADFEYCHIKAVNRSYKYVSVKVNLYKVPVTKIKVNLALYKRYNGYKPFLYNITVDACKFLENPQKNPIANFLFGAFLPYTNANHLCPYNESVILDKLPIDYMNNYLTKVLPFPLAIMLASPIGTPMILIGPALNYMVLFRRFQNKNGNNLLFSINLSNT